MSRKSESPEESVYQKTLNRASDAIISVDTELRYTYLNQKAEELLGKTQSELLDEDISSAFPEAKNTIVQDRIEKALRTKQETQYERYNESVDSWFDVRVFPDTSGLSIFLSDITERKEREIELERYGQIIETLPVAVGQNAPGSEGEFEYVNQGMVEMFGFESKEKAKQYSPADLYADPQEREVFNEKIQATGEVTDFELELEKPTGERFWGSVTASLDTIDGEEYFIGVIQDITDRREYKHKLRNLHTATREMVSVTKPADIADIVTRAADQSIGYEMNGVHFYDESVDGLVPVSVSDTSQELIGDAPVLDAGIAWRAFQTGETRVCNNLKEANKVFNEGTALRSELAIPLGNYGVLLASDTEIGAFRDADLTLIKILAKNAEAALDRLQTERQLRNREEELARQQAFLKQTQEVADIGGWELDIRADTLRWTDELYRIHGVDSDFEPTVEGAIDLYHPEDKATIKNAVERATTDGEPYDKEVRIVRPDGEVRWTRTRGEPRYEDGAIVGVRGTFQDITERKERELELERHRNVIQAVDDGVYALDEAGHFELVNDAMTELTGYETEELFGEYTGRIKSDAEVERVESIVRSMISGEREDDEVTLELDIQRDDGSEFPAEDHMTVLRDDDGERFEGTAGIVRDITERKERERELQTTNEQLEVLNRILRHDIQNDVQVIQAWTEKLKTELPETHEDDLQRIYRTNESIRELTENARELLRSFTQDEIETESVRLDHIIERELNSAQSRYPNANVTIDGSLSVAVVSANGTLSSVVRNLLNNAVQHNHDPVTVTVRVKQDSGAFHLLIADNGPGVPDDQKETIFGKGERGLESDGTGIGLYLVNKLVQSYGGDVRVEDSDQYDSLGQDATNDSGGAVFVVELPTVTN